MKLKKIVSLALAGILAVSMLTACGDKGSSSSEGETEVVATGYSAMLAKELKETAAKSYVTFQDNAEDEAALKKMLGSYANKDLIAAGQAAGLGYFIQESTLSTAKDLEDYAKLDGYVNNFTFNAKKEMLGTWKVGQLYIADGTVDMNSVIKNVATKIGDAALKAQLVEKGTDASQVISAKYSYVVSASVVNVKGTENLQKNQSTTYVLVTITRTGVTD